MLQDTNSLLIDNKNLERLGNKSLLEKSINIIVSDFRFEDKIKKYKGYKNDKGKIIEGTKIKELLSLNEIYKEFNEKDIEKRNNLIINTFINYLETEDLCK